ncbi:MAG: hypothetical protein HC845_04945 [Akkermansiaceae bacterium]|nr:hypothetical protein [Akkermansiaceae bacterium]
MSDSITIPENANFAEIGEVLRNHQSFVLISHVRPDGDAIGSQLALGFSLMAAGKNVRLINEDGLPDNLTFMAGSEKIERPPTDPLDVEVAIALDTATKPRLGDHALHAASKAKIWLNIDHHISNPKYGDLNLVDSTSPATGQILYQLITALNLPMPAETRDAIYVAVSTDTGSFQYPSTTAATYEMAADLTRRGLDVGTINSNIYDNYPYRRVELMRALLNTLEIPQTGSLQIGSCAIRRGSISPCSQKIARASSTSSAPFAAFSLLSFSRNSWMENPCFHALERSPSRCLSDCLGIRWRWPRPSRRDPHGWPVRKCQAACVRCHPPPHPRDWPLIFTPIDFYL